MRLFNPYSLYDNQALAKFSREHNRRFSRKVSALISFNGLFAFLQVLTKDSVTVSVDAGKTTDYKTVKEKNNN
jgi:hypothetical protein